MTDDLLRYRIAARLWQSQAEALYEEYACLTRKLDPEGPGMPFDKIQMIAAITRLIDHEVDAVTHLKDKG